MVGSDIPEGQGSVTALLAECFDMAYELRNDAEAREDEDEEEGGDESESNVVGTKA